jgi:dipeptidyl aminopeptidase/acylaminoacyl peptidase
MEPGLLASIWRKLIEALKFGGPTKAPRTDLPSLRENESFKVISDGIQIRGTLYFPTAHPARQYPVVIICHGIPSGNPAAPNEPTYGDLALRFTSLGLAAATFNFRGCGDSGGDFDIQGWVRDLGAVFEKILDTPHVDPTRLILLGFSGGGAAAIKFSAEDSRVYGLSVVGTPATFEIFDKDPQELIEDLRTRGIIRSHNFPADVSRWMNEFREIEPAKWISQLQAKHLLIIHGDQDEVVPVEHADILFRNAPAGIGELKILPGGVHRLRTDERCIELLSQWFMNILSWKRP